MNNLYHNKWRIFQNFFCPTLKLKEKQRVNSKYIKKYYPPATPRQRLRGSDDVSNDTKNRLITTFLNIDPFALKKTIQAKLKMIFNT